MLSIIERVNIAKSFALEASEDLKKQIPDIKIEQTAIGFYVTFPEDEKRRISVSHASFIENSLYWIMENISYSSIYEIMELGTDKEMSYASNMKELVTLLTSLRNERQTPDDKKDEKDLKLQDNKTDSTNDQENDDQELNTLAGKRKHICNTTTEQDLRTENDSNEEKETKRVKHNDDRPAQ
jgi:hypothetical protein